MVHGFLIVVTSLLQSTGSVVAAQGLSGSVAMWNLPRPGLEPMYPALAGGFLTTGPPGKSENKFDPLCPLQPLSKSSIPPDQVEVSGNNQVPESRL